MYGRVWAGRNNPSSVSLLRHFCLPLAAGPILVRRFRSRSSKPSCTKEEEKFIYKLANGREKKIRHLDQVKCIKDGADKVLV
ncbi:hypothetical protein MTR_4g134300 [Medicago truncatula]|uniref:Uncharacterized protein n=1 Tax=Medicago truncatula TaxID=3880 RepID=G7ZZU3_MEDTR|nr:hypothetical protein MTR_4g134300 [Medicago truncatula]